MSGGELAAALAAVCGEAHVQAGAAIDRALLSDWTGTVSGAAQAAVFPGDVREVSETLALCNARGVGVIPQGGNTGMSGGGVPLAGGGERPAIILSLRRLNRIREIDQAAHTLTAEAGCALETVCAHAAVHDLFFPLALGAKGSCHIGGNLATNAGGLNVLRYGNVRDWCLGIEAALADGRILRGLSKLHKDNSGYDLRHLLIGSEGTLAVITAATLKLLPPPQICLTAWALPPTAQAALELFNFIERRSPGALTAYELMPRAMLELIARYKPQLALPAQGALPEWAALLEAADADGERLQEILMQAIDAGLADNVLLAAGERQRAAFWQTREEAPLIMARHGRWLRADVAVPRSALPAFIGALRARLTAVCEGRYIIGFGHAGDGNLHLQLRPRDEDPQAHPELTKRLAAALYDCAAAHGGTFSAEHGIGQLKTGLMNQYKDPTALAMMRAVKRALDENNILNPGKVLSAEAPS